MDPIRLRANQRERALARLARLTTATAVAGTFATVGFGGLAAATYSGKPTTPVDQTTTDNSGALGQDYSNTDGSTPPNSGTNGTTTDPQSTTTSPSTTSPSTTTQRIPTVQPPTRTRTHSHVVSGGSGG
jgi:hypothetical protein